jgi:hypothetical protein
MTNGAIESGAIFGVITALSAIFGVVIELSAITLVLDRSPFI